MSSAYSKLETEKVAPNDAPNTTSQGAPPAYTPQATPAVVTLAPTTTKVVSGVNGEPLIKDYLVLSIITTFFCFMPLGFVALIKSIETRSALQRGDYATARAASNSARSFNKISIIVGAVILVFTLFIVVVSQLSWIIPLAIGAYKEDDRKN